VYPDSDSGEVNIYTRGADYYENKFVRQIIKPGDFIIDAGCNVGNRTLVLSDIISGALLIEPNKKCLERLSTIFKFNNINMSNYYLVPKCVSNKHGFCYFTNYGGTSTQNKITLEPYENSYQVEVTTIDYEMTLIGNPICTYIKFDLEGYDYEGVCGSINTLQNNQVKLIKFELLNSSQLHLFNNFFSKINWIVFSLNQFGKPTLKKNANLKNLNYFACPKKYFSDILT
jgi:FkbM family methyltransferase